MNPWLRGLWDTIHFQHRCVSGSIWQKVQEGKREDGGSLCEECIAWMYVLMFDPTERCTGTKRASSPRNLGGFCSSSPFVTPFVLDQDDNLVCWSHLKNHGSLVPSQRCGAALPPAESSGNCQWEGINSNVQCPCMHACTQTNAPNYKHGFATVKLQWRMMISWKDTKITDKQNFLDGVLSHGAISGIQIKIQE